MKLHDRPDSPAQAERPTDSPTMTQPRPMPMMRLVTKGWWVMREEPISLEDLKKLNDAERD